MRRAVLVFGPECSGTRLMASILMYAGCTGSSEHHQWWDDQPFEAEDDLVVWRRSFPHGQERGWPNVARMAERLDWCGYTAQAVVMVRESPSLARSQVARGYAEDDGAAHAQIGEAYFRIFDALWVLKIPRLVVTYEGLVQRPQRTQEWLAEVLELPHVPYVQVTDENEKHWDGHEVGNQVRRTSESATHLRRAG